MVYFEVFMLSLVSLRFLFPPRLRDYIFDILNFKESYIV